MTAATNQPELELLQRYQRGEAAAFTEIVSRFGGMVFSACLRVTHDKHVAEDLAQETFFKLSQRPHEVTRSLGAWLHCVATRAAIDSLRRGKARDTHELAAARHAEAIRSEANKDEITWSQIGPMLDAALTELPEASRDIIVRHYLMGQSQRQVAAETGMSQATVSRRLAIALDQLRRRLAKSGVTAGVTGLAGLLTSMPAHAAPPSVTGSAGGMSLLTQTTGLAPPIAWCPVLAKAAMVVVPVAGLSLGLVLIVSGLAAAMDQAASPSRAAQQQQLIEPADAEPTETEQEDQQALRLVFAVPEQHAFSSTYITSVHIPSMDEDDQAQLVYADGHVVSMPRGEAIDAIQSQTGKRFVQLSQQQQSLGLSGAKP